MTHDREVIATKIADRDWCPEHHTEYLKDEFGYVVTQAMFIGDAEIDAYINKEKLNEAHP